MDASDSSIQSVSNQVIDIEVNNEPRYGIERTNVFANTNEVRKKASESTPSSAKRIKLKPVPETEAWKSDSNEDHNVIDVSGNGQESAEDTSDVLEEAAVKKPNSGVGKSTLTRDTLTREITLSTDLDESECPSADDPLIDSKMTLIEKFNSDSPEFEALLNGQSFSPQTIKIGTEISASRKRLVCDTVENAAKRQKTSMNSPTMNEYSMDQLDENNTASVNVSLSSKPISRSSDSVQGSPHHEVVNEMSSSKDSIFTSQTASSSVDCSLLKYFRLNTEIREEELAECVEYLSKLCPKNDSLALFFENSERKLIKQSKALSSLAADYLAILSILGEKSKCNSNAQLNLQATSREIDLIDEDFSSFSLLSIKELVKILGVTSVSSACLDNSNLNDSVNIPSGKSTDEGQLLNVPDLALHNPHSKESSSSLPNEETKVKLPAICGPILCSESENVYKVASDRDTSCGLSSSRKRELFIRDMKAVMAQIEAINELLKSFESRYSRLLSSNDQPTLQLSRNHSEESDGVQILNTNKTNSISTDHDSISRNRYSENTSAMVTSSELNCVTFTEPVIEEMECLGRKPVFNDPIHSADIVFEISSAQTSTQGPGLSESSENLEVAIEQVVVKEYEEVQCLGGEPPVFNDTTHSPNAVPETSSAQTSTDELGISESNKELQILSIKPLKEYKNTPHSANEDPQNSLTTSDSIKEGKVKSPTSEIKLFHAKPVEISESVKQIGTVEKQIVDSPMLPTAKKFVSKHAPSSANAFGVSNYPIKMDRFTQNNVKITHTDPRPISCDIANEIKPLKTKEILQQEIHSTLDKVETAAESKENTNNEHTRIAKFADLKSRTTVCKMSYLEKTNIDDQNNSFTSETLEDGVDILKENISSPIHKKQSNKQNDKLKNLERSRDYVNSNNRDGKVMELDVNVSDPKSNCSRFTFERDIENTESTVLKSRTNICEMSCLEKTNIANQNNSFAIETLEDGVDILKENISLPIHRKQPYGQNSKPKHLEQSRNYVNASNKDDKVKEMALNVSDPKMNCPKFVESSTAAERDIENTESTNTQGAQNKSIEIPGSSLMSKIFTSNLTISVASDSKRIVRAHEPNILSIVRLTPMTLESQTQPQQSSSGEVSPSVQDSPISNSEIGTQQKAKNIAKESYTTRTSVDLEIMHNSYLQLSRALETFKAEDNRQNLEAPTNVELPKRIPSVAISKKASSSISFGKRKGNRAYLAECSYKNVGKTFITNDNLSSLILEWNATWLSTQNEMNMAAPICDKYYHVKDRYVDELDYYNTYFPLHLLSTWFKISDSWNKNTATFDSVFETERELRNVVKVTCYTALNPARCVTWFRREDILLCRALKPGGGAKELFGRICNVIYTDYESGSKHCSTSSRLKKVTFQFLCAEALDVPNLIIVKIQILGNIRTALLQNDALQNLNGVMKNLILDPENHRSRIDFISLYPRHHEAFLKRKEDIIDSTMSPDVHVTLVDALIPWHITFVTFQLAVTLMKEKRHVLIGVRHVDTLIELAVALKGYNLVLAVKGSEVRLPEDLRKFSLEERCVIMNRHEVFFKCHVTLTLMSSIYVGDLGDALAEQQPTCILPEAHLCTEAESALLLYYNVRHLVLIGRNERNPNLHSALKHFGYDISLFSRLHKVK